MLENTFIHIPGIGSKTEENLWCRGIRTWRHFLDHGETIISPARDEFIVGELEASWYIRKTPPFSASGFHQGRCGGPMMHSKTTPFISI